MTSAVVVGYGSIGQRHARLLRELGCDVAVVSGRRIADAIGFVSIEEALRAKNPAYVVVANETAKHAEAIQALQAADFSGRLLVEKPLGDLNLIKSKFALAAVAYNLRFHLVIAALRDAIAREETISIQIYCGQSLPDWRPGRDYRTGYSADAARGGGVLRDLSHELDYLLWLAGPWRRVAAIGGQFSKLEIRSDDCWAILLETERCQMATVQIYYLDRPGFRQIVVNTANHTYRADLSQCVFETDGKPQSFKIGRDDTFLAQHKAVLSGDMSRLCGFDDAVQVMKLIYAIEHAAREGTWISA